MADKMKNIDFLKETCASKIDIFISNYFLKRNNNIQPTHTTDHPPDHHRQTDIQTYRHTDILTY